jgi:3-phosphoshikimate 1-carboxyvinyltransferase
MAALANGLTTIHRPLVARETWIMLEACRALSAEVLPIDDRFDVRGIGGKFSHSAASAPQASTRYIWAGGSALVARLFLTIGSALPENVVVDGGCNLRARPFQPLIAALRDKSVEFSFFDAENRLPCMVLSTAFPGGHYQLGTDVSSQFITSLLIAAPLAASPLSIGLTGANYSLSYIRQTIEMMAHFGIAVETEDDMRQILVPRGQRYQARDVKLTGDYTSASYILGATFVTRGHIKLSNLDPSSMQGEKAILNILVEFGARVQWIHGASALLIDCTDIPNSVHATFDLSDCPNILPTVAVIAATVRGRVRIVGGRLTQNHKSRRIEAIAAELGKAGVSVHILEDRDGFVDGLQISGKERYEGDVVFSNHEDHRIAMAMMVFTLVCSKPCSFNDSADTADSFPGFVNYLGLVADQKQPEAIPAELNVS